MQKDKATSNKEKENIGPVEAYNILLQRQINEDRIVVERSSVFFLATSFLFLAFVMLLNPNLAPIFKVLRIALPILCIFLTFLLFHLNRSATNALAFWHSGQQKIEETAPEFTYMGQNEITPHLHGYEAIRGEREWKRIKKGKWVFRPTEKPGSWLNKPLQQAWLRHIYDLYLPAIFLVLWVTSLIVAIKSVL